MPFDIQSLHNLPQELSARTLPLVGFSGLDTVNNAVHKAVWEAFSTNNRRTERIPISFKLIRNDHEFPVFKPKRNLYDWYIPKGILKKNWMKKYLYEIPSVMVVFYDLDWNDSQWNEKMIECASRVQSLRAALEGRNTRLNVVLIQHTPPMPSGEDMLANDRAVALCASCELNMNSLFVLPHNDHLQGYALRLENAFYEFAQTYYHGEIKKVRAHKDQLSKNSHQYLFVRHQFKMGFLYELKQDKHTAHKHYTHAYNNLLEIRIVDTNALEIRTIAGFINYKLCRLMFALNLPRDAISQFKAHVDHFKNPLGFHELTFEHFAWLSTQFSIFGDIFDEAVKLGLPAVQTQHPGIYYQQAAQYAVLRKKWCQELCANVHTYPRPDPLENIDHMEYFGQRPWRPGKLTAEPPDPKVESDGIQALQYLEKQVNHSNIIVSLYGMAVSQYKTYKCPRTRRHLVLQMADEYYNSQDFGKALTLLTHMLCDFRSENWWVLMTNVLEKAIKCAFLTASIVDYVVLALEILARSSMLSLEGKKKIHVNLHRILKRQFPFGDGSLEPEILQNAILQWQPVLTNNGEPLNIVIDVSNIVACVETKAKFLQKQYEINQKVAVEVYIRCTSPLLLSFTKVSVTINGTSSVSEYAIDDSPNGVDVGCLQFQPGEVKKYLIEFSPDVSDVNKEIQIGAINLTMGDPRECSFNLKFGVTVSDDVAAVCAGLSALPELSHFKYNGDDKNLDFDNIAPQCSTLIVPKRSNLDVQVEYDAPALVGEWFKILIRIENKETCDIENLVVQINSLDDDDLTINEFSTNASGIPQKVPLRLSEIGENLQLGNTATSHFYLRSHQVSQNAKIEMKLSYAVQSTDQSSTEKKSVLSTKTLEICVPVVMPFEITTKFLSSLMHEITKFYVGERVGVMPIVRCLSPKPIIIEETSIKFSPPFRSTCNVSKSLKNVTLQTKEVATELFLGVCDKQVDQNITVGQYAVKWKRADGLSTTSHLSVTGHPSEWIPLELKVKTPAHGFVRTPFLITYQLYNRSTQLLQLDVSMEASEAFMYAGYKQSSVSVQPECTRDIQYNLYPLIAGNVALPKLIIQESNIENPIFKQDQLKHVVDRSVPTHLYVMPQTKGNPKSNEAVLLARNNVIIV